MVMSIALAKSFRAKFYAFAVVAAVAFVASGNVWAQGNEAAFKIGGKTTTMRDLQKQDQAAFYKVEKDRYDLIERMAQEKYLDYFWQQEAKKNKTSVEGARKAYFDKRVKVSDQELKETLERFKDHPNLKKLPPAEQEAQIRAYLADRQGQDAMQEIIMNGMRNKELVISYPRPKEPVFAVTVGKQDHVRYGPNPEDSKPLGCEGDACAITVVEYSEFECPYCTRVLPAVERLMTEYKGKVRWIVRDFPLSFHERARPAAIAAKCAADQGKYWHMYKTLFANQQNLQDADLEKYADQIGIDKKQFKECVAKPEKVNKVIEANLESGAKLGVSGTPAFFINGRRLSGALPYDEFKKVFDEELSKKRS